MELGEYFADRKGTGILATADADGKVDAAIFARPHVLEDGTVAFIMRERLTHHNLQSNPYAIYLFIEEGGGYRGIRLFLRKIREEEESSLLNELRRKTYSEKEEKAAGVKHLVIFSVEKELPLVGAGSMPS